MKKLNLIAILCCCAQFHKGCICHYHDIARLVNPDNKRIIRIFDSNHCQMNRLFLLHFGMVSLVAHAQVPDYVPAEGLVAWYPFNGNAMNEVNTEDEFNVIGPINTSDRFGIPANAYYFDGIDDEIIASNPGASGSEISLSFWYQSAQVDYSAYLIAFGGPAWGTYFEVLNNHWSAQTPGPCYGPALSGGGTLVSRGTEWMPDSLVWHHCAIILPEGALSLNDVLFYFDGSMLTSVCSFANYGAPEPSISISENILFGSGFQDQGNWSSHFEGSMDDIGIWNRALTEEEILALYNAPAPVPGCTDPTACNFDAEATSDDGSCIPSGCMELEACNYNALAECEGEACEYTCCPGPGCCSAGMYWDYDLEQCMNYETCQDDLDGDGVIGVNDLMQLLSSFGTDCAPAEEPETTEFTCGDPVSYHGYDYATVQIGEQCWFAENLRTELYSNGDSIPHLIDCDSWSSAPNGAYCHYDNEPDSTNSSGLLYNWFATNFPNGICPSEWHVPSDAEWMTLEMELGMSESEANSTYWRGTDEGSDVKSNLNWNGSNTSGFGAIPGGTRGPYNGCEFAAIEYGTWYWTSTGNGSLAVGRGLTTEESRIVRMTSYQLRNGFSVRCIKD